MERESWSRVQEFAGGWLLAASVTALVYLVIVELARLFALIFGAILVAIAISGLGRLINFRNRLPHALAVSLVIVIALGFCAGLGAWLGPQVVAQIGELDQKIRQGVANARSLLDSALDFLEQHVPSLRDGVLPRAGSIVQSTGKVLSSGFGTLTDAVVVLLLGFFLAVNPSRYERGLLLLVPRARRERGRAVLRATAHTLRYWLVARGVLMLLVGTLFAIGLAILDVPFAVPLGIIAGILDFIPYLGPVLGAIPALAVAFLGGPERVLWVLGLYLVVQFVESYIAGPLVESKAVTLPPGLLLAFQVLCAAWLGVLGVLLATPLLVALVVGVQMIYVQDVLGEDIRIAGEH
ncbi:MAG: AI-2E family transporter [Pseudomonadota bacterium]